MQYLRHILPVFLTWLLLPVGAFAITPTIYQKQVITIAADSWCPINCARPETRLGVGIDLAKAIYEPLGYQINYIVMPWSQALEQVRAGRVDAVIGADHTDDASLIFPSHGIVGTSDDFYVLKGISWRYQGVHTLKGKKLGVIRDYGYGSVVDGYVNENQANYNAIQFEGGDEALKANIKKLMNREIDVLVETRPVMEYTMARLKLEGNIIWAGGTTPTPVYLAFSPALPQSRALAAQFDAGMRRLAEGGQLQGIYAAYGLTHGSR